MAINEVELDSAIGSHMDEPDLYAPIFEILRNRFDVDFTQYRRGTIERQVRRRCEARQTEDLTRYADLLSADPAEAEALYDALLIDVTAFFRDKTAFRLLNDLAVADLVAGMSAERPVRVWVPGCSTGEEAYSLAILFAEEARKNAAPLNLQIFATDLHARYLDLASKGVYETEFLDSVDEALRNRYFEQVGRYHQVKSLIRDLVVFSRHDAITDPPFANIDLISCRNLLIHLADLAQDNLLDLFRFALVKDGFLFLGPGETPGTRGSVFRAVDNRWRIFRKIHDERSLAASAPGGHAGSMNRDKASPADAWLQTGVSSRKPDACRAYNAALEQMLERYAPNGFLLTVDGALVHIFGDASELLTFEEGRFSASLFDLLPRPLGLMVESGLHRMKSTGYAPFRRSLPLDAVQGCTIHSVRMEPLPDPDGRVEFVLLAVEGLADGQASEPDDGKHVESNPSESSVGLEARVRELEGALESTEEDLRKTIKQLETGNADLQAANEALLASNAELQSMNEELRTVSREHRRSVAELNELSADMTHLLKANDIGTVFLNRDLTIRRFTPGATRTFNLLPQDTGRPFTHVASRFESTTFLDSVIAASELGQGFDEAIQVDGHHYLLRVLPYQDDSASPEGLLIAAIDVHESKVAQKRLVEMAAEYDQVLTDIPQGIVCWRRSDGIVTYCNQRFSEIHGFDRDLVDEITFDDLVRTNPNLKDIPRDQITSLQPGETRVLHVAIEDGMGKTQWRDVHCRAFTSTNGTDVYYMGTGTDVTDRVRQVNALKALNEIDIGEVEDVSALSKIVLDIGKFYFGLSEGIYSNVKDENYRVVSHRGSQNTRRKLCGGAAISLSQMPCSLTMSERQLVSYVESPGNQESFDFAIGGDRIKTYIGAPIVVARRLAGTLCFFELDGDRFEQFSDADKDFMRLLARWFELMVAHFEQSERLRNSERELQLIFDNVPARIWYKDDKNTILRLNETAARSMGISVEDAKGANTYDLFPEMAKKYHDDDLVVINGGRPVYGLIEEYTPRDGERGWVSTDKIPYTTEDGNQRSVLVVATDVTDLKRRELELAGVNSKLDAQRKSFEDLYKRTPVMMHSIDTDGNIVEVSDTWLQKLGYSRDEVIGRKSTEFLTEASRRYSDETVLPEFWRNGYCDSVPYTFIRADGSTVDIELSGIVDQSEEGQGRTLAVLVDVTDRNAAFEALGKANSDLEHANEGLKKFAYVASHDLQEPLRKIQQFGDMLFSEYSNQLDDNAKFYMNVMQDASIRMRRLIRDLLTFSEAANTELRRDSIDLGILARRACSDLGVAIGETEADVEIGDLPTVEGDEAFVQQIFNNLLSNALKYRNQENQPVIRVVPVSTETHTGFSVIDNGIGIAKENQPGIFDAFLRLHAQNEIEGSGIGLAICQTVCDRLGWEISVVSARGEGSSFTVQIPR